MNVRDTSSHGDAKYGKPITNKNMGRTGICADRHTDRRTERHKDRQTDGQTN